MGNKKFDERLYAQAVCVDGVVRRVRFTGECDTAFTRPAYVCARGKKIRGYVTALGSERHMDRRAALNVNLDFVATGANRYALSVWAREDGTEDFEFTLPHPGSTLYYDPVRPGALVQANLRGLDDSGSWSFLRIMNVVTHNGVGEPYSTPHFAAMVLSDDARHAFEIHVSLDDIRVVLPTTGTSFIADFFGDGFDAARARHLSKLGAYNRRYFDRYRGQADAKECTT